MRRRLVRANPATTRPADEQAANSRNNRPVAEHNVCKSSVSELSPQ